MRSPKSARLSTMLSPQVTCYTASDGGMGEAFFKLTKTINLLIKNQEKVLSTVVDAIGLLGNPHPSYASAAASKQGNNRPPKDPHANQAADPGEQKVRKVKQAI